jgi:enolase
MIGTEKGLSTDGMIEYLQQLTRTYPLRTIEDPLAEDDWNGWSLVTEKLGQERLIIGDDLFVTSKARLEQGITKKAGNAILIKPNQIGSVSETLSTIRLAQEHRIPTIVSHRSGETSDSSLIDIALGTGSPWVKIGAPARGERVAKYNRLLEWWERERG